MREFLAEDCFGLIGWMLGAIVAFYNDAMAAAFICTFFSGVAVSQVCREISDMIKKERDS